MHVSPTAKSPLSRTERSNSQARQANARPFCHVCGAHIGTAGFGLCGVCAQLAHGKPVRLSLTELMRMARLVKRHWAGGGLRDLLFAQNGTPEGYRPNLVCRPLDALRYWWTDAELRAHARDCAERAELADLYDRAQGARGDGRRAVRS